MQPNISEPSDSNDDWSAWRQFYDDLDLKVIGTQSKGSNSRLSIAVISAEGSHLYAFVSEAASGQLEDSTQLDDA